MEYAAYIIAVAALLGGALLYRRWQRRKIVRQDDTPNAGQTRPHLRHSASYEVRGDDIERVTEFYFTNRR